MPRFESNVIANLRVIIVGATPPILLAHHFTVTQHTWQHSNLRAMEEQCLIPGQWSARITQNSKLDDGDIITDG